MELKQFDEAAKQFAAFASRYGDSPQVSEANYRQAYCLHRLEKYEQSHVLCEIIAKGPKSNMTAPAAELDAENLFLLAKYPDAEKAFAGLERSGADDTKLHRYTLREGQCEYFTGNYARAAELLRPVAEAGKSNEETLQAQFLLGDAPNLLQQKRKREAAAVDALKKYLASAKGDQREARYKLALAQARTQDEAAAIKTLIPLTDGPKEDAWVQRGLLEAGQLQYNAKKPDRASDAC